MKDFEVFNKIEEMVYGIKRPEKEHIFENLKNYDLDDSIVESEQTDRQKKGMIEKILESDSIN